MGFFGNSFSQPSKMKLLKKRNVILFTWSMFLVPTLAVYVISHPDLLEWYFKRTKPLVYPPTD